MGPIDMLAAVLDYAQSHLVTTLVAVVFGTIALSMLSAALTPPPRPVVYTPTQIGDITLASLARYSGRDPFLPICFAIRGKVLDVTEGRSFYGPGQLTRLRAQDQDHGFKVSRSHTL